MSEWKRGKLQCSFFFIACCTLCSKSRFVCTFYLIYGEKSVIISETSRVPIICMWQNEKWQKKPPVNGMHCEKERDIITCSSSGGRNVGTTLVITNISNWESYCKNDVKYIEREKKKQHWFRDQFSKQRKRKNYQKKKQEQ